MPDSSLLLFLVIIVIGVSFGLANGFNDAANSIAGVIGSRILHPRSAIIMAAFCEFAGAATGTAVAATIGKGIITPEALTYDILITALASAILWAVFATFRGLPVSVSHSLVCGLVGAGLAMTSGDDIIWGKVLRVGLAVFCAPLLGFVGGLILMITLLWVFRRAVPGRVRGIFSNGAILSSAFMAYSHGKNDGQMPIGVITMALVLYSGRLDYWDNIPWWVIFISALAISLGTAFGGWRVIKTVGFKITRLGSEHAFIANTSAATVIEIASHLGIPVSTTHCISSAVMGVGATKRLSAVRWGVAGEIVTAWVVTFPACAAMGWLFAWLLRFATG